MLRTTLRRERTDLYTWRSTHLDSVPGNISSPSRGHRLSHVDHVSTGDDQIEAVSGWPTHDKNEDDDE